ncbi:MAG: dTMP kinase, partial [Pseudomonadota bacterium]
MAAKRGAFISFEGADGVGKSTQVARVGDALAARGCTVLTTREPGGAPGAEAIRTLLKDPDGPDWLAASEALMMSAARAEHLDKTIAPALARGAVVLCDRFADSTTVYQAYAGGLPLEAVMALHRVAVGSQWPDLTLVMAASARTAMARRGARGPADRFEAKG